MKKEIVDIKSLIDRYRCEIEDLKHRLGEEKEAPARFRRSSAREVSPHFVPILVLSHRVGGC